MKGNNKFQISSVGERVTVFVIISSYEAPDSILIAIVIPAKVVRCVNAIVWPVVSPVGARGSIFGLVLSTAVVFSNSSERLPY